MIRKKNRPPAEIPSSSMSDIAFLLLVFFLLVSNVDTDKGIGVVLPPPGDSEIKLNPKNITMVLVNASGDVLFNDQLVPIAEISQRARELEAGNPNMVFSVQTDRKTKYQDYIDVVDQLTIANVKKLALIGTQ
ncbi:MAG: biopolymer transporter ExbD [Candidatus Marinimicrobia bacterium]|jgi:biopolymer transport protein ExbD|nr:biopolymer transporter ExbD [Candidatus Neomarinimicrobiota bacterium]MDD4960653.1 biopolymer transporter ExbD [Candidatus Neomarinimicrobiota bacterium]MDD5709852.1 biopolymer transporter ExbD [Candidatus Neomarinimicrobiota bacterium]MDX9777542.1 biopolymer transporter ExbD [bacterium]